MANPNERVIALGGKTYPVRLSIGVLSRAESRADRNYLTPSVWDGGLRPSDVLALVWAIVSEAENPERLPVKDDAIYERLSKQLAFGPELYDIRSALYAAAVDAVAPIQEEPTAPFGPAGATSGPEPGSTSASVTASTSA